MYKKVSTTLDFAGRERIPWPSGSRRVSLKRAWSCVGRARLYLLRWPPTANGKPHIGHILTRSIKDIIPRYRTMKGYDVLRKAGWDTHGLPVELEVEKNWAWTARSRSRPMG